MNCLCIVAKDMRFLNFVCLAYLQILFLKQSQTNEIWGQKARYRAKINQA